MNEQAISDATSDPVTARTRAVIEAFHAAFNQHDVDAVMRLMTDDCVFENTYPPPDGSRSEGQTAVRAFWHELFSGSPQARFETEEIIAAGDRGVLRWTYHWIDQNQQAGHVRGVDIFRVRDNKIAEKFSYVKG
ncbi:nuclear transport factor 2 family protein [soil metagenome]